jgi:hypothetical protein
MYTPRVCKRQRWLRSKRSWPRRKALGSAVCRRCSLTHHHGTAKPLGSMRACAHQGYRRKAALFQGTLPEEYTCSRHSGRRPPRAGPPRVGEPEHRSLVQIPRGVARSGEHDSRTVESFTRGRGARAEIRSQHESMHATQADWPVMLAQQSSGTRRAWRPSPQQSRTATQPATDKREREPLDNSPVRARAKHRPQSSLVKVAPQSLVDTRYTDDDGAAERITRMRKDYKNFRWQLHGEAADSVGVDGMGVAARTGSALTGVARGRDDAKAPARQPDASSYRGQPALNGSPYRGPPKRQPAPRGLAVPRAAEAAAGQRSPAAAAAGEDGTPGFRGSASLGPTRGHTGSALGWRRRHSRRRTRSHSSGGARKWRWAGPGGTTAVAAGGRHARGRHRSDGERRGR